MEKFLSRQVNSNQTDGKEIQWEIISHTWQLIERLMQIWPTKIEGLTYYTVAKRKKGGEREGE